MVGGIIMRLKYLVDDEFIEFEVDNKIEDIFEYYGLENTPENTKIIQTIFDDLIYGLENNDEYLDFLKDKYYDDFIDSITPDDSAVLQIWDVM